MSNVKWLAVLVAGMIAILAVSSLAFSTESPAPAKPAVSKEMREKMAIAHEHMATCLRSERSMEDCHHEMMQSHEMMKGSEPMMHGHEHETTKG